MKKTIRALAALAAITSVFGSIALTGCGGGSDGDHDFTILAVKENTVADYNQMPVFKKLGAETGYDVFWKFNTSSQYSQNATPLSDKKIDAIYHAGFSNLELYNYGRRKTIVAIDEHLDAMPNFKAILDSRPDIEEALKSPDGHIYSLPRIEEMGLKTYPNILFLNKSWVEQLIDTNSLPSDVKLKKSDLKDGLDLTRAQFKSLLQAFRDGGDLNGNGKNDEVPLSFVHGNWQGNESDLIASFGVPENAEHKTIKNGKIAFTFEDEKWFNAIVELRDWHQSNLIPTTCYEQNQDYFLAHGQNGEYGAFYWWEKETVVKQEFQDDYIIVKPLIGDDGKRYVGKSNELEVEKAECVIKSACKDVDGLLSYFDKFFEPDYSAQLNYGSIESGAFLPEKQDGKLIPNTDHGAQSADDFRMRNAPYGVIYLTSEVFETSVEMEPRAKLRQERLAEYTIPYVVDGITNIPNLNYTAEELQQLNNVESDFGKAVENIITTWITLGNKPTKTDWNNFLSKNSNAIKTIKEINQAAYDRYVAATNKN